MSSRFNTLYLGSADDAADQLEQDSDSVVDATADDLRVALINALRAIGRLERRVVQLGYTGNE